MTNNPTQVELVEGLADELSSLSIAAGSGGLLLWITPQLRDRIIAALRRSSTVNDELVEARAENERLFGRLAETQMLATKWMDAHDNLRAGLPYDLPKTADLPDEIARLVEALKCASDSLAWVAGKMKTHCCFTVDVDKASLAANDARAALAKINGGE